MEGVIPSELDVLGSLPSVPEQGLLTMQREEGTYLFIFPTNSLARKLSNPGMSVIIYLLSTILISITYLCNENDCWFLHCSMFLAMPGMSYTKWLVMIP